MMPFEIIKVKTQKEYVVLQIYFSRKAFDTMVILKSQTNTITEVPLDIVMDNYEFVQFIKI